MFLEKVKSHSGQMFGFTAAFVESLSTGRKWLLWVDGISLSCNFYKGLFELANGLKSEMSAVLQAGKFVCIACGRY